MLVALAEELDTSVSTLLGETVSQAELPQDQLKIISDKLEVINLQLAQRSCSKIRAIRHLLFLVCAGIFALFLGFAAINGEYLTWDFRNPELLLVGTLLHGFEFVLVRAAPFILIGSAMGILYTYKKP